MREAPECRATDWAKFLSRLAQRATRCYKWPRQTHGTKIDTLVSLFPPHVYCVALALVETVMLIYLRISMDLDLILILFKMA